MERAGSGCGEAGGVSCVLVIGKAAGSAPSASRSGAWDAWSALWVVGVLIVLVIVLRRVWSEKES